jgi:RNA polymerase sigma factor (TIGR02999 family)
MAADGEQSRNRQGLPGRNAGMGGRTRQAFGQIPPSREETSVIRYQPGVTELLADWRKGDDQAGHQVLSHVYAELRQLAERYLRREGPGHTLQATALVHEAYLRLAGGGGPPLSSRAHLIGVAARLMRQILVNHALRRRTAKRGGGWRRVPLDATVAIYEERCVDLVAIDRALDELAELDSRQAQIVELRFFGGLAVEEVARLLDVSPRTIEHEWTMARAWLRRAVAA